MRQRGIAVSLFDQVSGQPRSELQRGAVVTYLRANGTAAAPFAVGVVTDPAIRDPYTNQLWIQVRSPWTDDGSHWITGCAIVDVIPPAEAGVDTDGHEAA
jgi:hypothetical protein